MSQAIIDLDKEYILQTYARADFVIERGEGCYLYDTNGHRYLDCVAGIAVNALGYGDADVTAAIAQHAGGLLHLSNLYHNTSGAKLAKSLVNATPWAARTSSDSLSAIDGTGIGRCLTYRTRNGCGRTVGLAFIADD
jgi:acetylornithine/N-succinyldiaminopimelate aminotransferase